MPTQRLSPDQYFENQTLLENGTNYFEWLIFGGICIVAITAMVIIASRK